MWNRGAESTHSLSSSILEYREINGRTYHKYSSDLTSYVWVVTWQYQYDHKYTNMSSAHQMMTLRMRFLISGEGFRQDWITPYWLCVVITWLLWCSIANCILHQYLKTYRTCWMLGLVQESGQCMSIITDQILLQHHWSWLQQWFRRWASSSDSYRYRFVAHPTDLGTTKSEIWDWWRQSWMDLGR